MHKREMKITQVNLDGMDASMMSGASPRNGFSTYTPLGSFAAKVKAHGTLSRGLSMHPAFNRKSISPLQRAY